MVRKSGSIHIEDEAVGGGRRWCGVSHREVILSR